NVAVEGVSELRVLKPERRDHRSCGDEPLSLPRNGMAKTACRIHDLFGGGHGALDDFRRHVAARVVGHDESIHHGRIATVRHLDVRKMLIIECQPVAPLAGGFELWWDGVDLAARLDELVAR